MSEHNHTAISEQTPVEFITLREQYQLELIREHYDAHYWRPRVQTDEFRIGHVCINQTDEMPTQQDLKGLSAAPLVVRSSGRSQVLAEPTGWKLLFPSDGRALTSGQLCIYRPICRENFVALSDVAAVHDGSGNFNPDPRFRCVHKALLRYSELLTNEIWKDNESTWNIQGSGFFMWAPTEQLPDDIHPYVLNSGSILSNLQLVDVISTPSAEVELIPQYLVRDNYNNASSLPTHHTFEAIRTQSRSVSGSWTDTSSTEIGLKFGLELALVFRAKAVVAEVEQSIKFSFENTVTRTETHSVGGGTTDLQTTTFRQECSVDVPPMTNVEVSACIYRAKYDVRYEGKLRLDSGAPGAMPIEISVTGNFGHQIDTEETWWQVSNPGTFLGKKVIPV